MYGESLNEQVKNYIKENKLTDHIILCSAASLSNFIIHDCYKDNPNNTYLDIGSTLNPYLTETNRGYLRGGNTQLKTCIW